MVQHLLFSITDHDRVDLIFLGDLAYCFNTLDYLKGNPGFELRRVLPSLLLHNYSSMIERNYEHNAITYTLVLMRGTTSDRYGRYVAVLFSQGVNVNEEMIASGNSWVHIYYCWEPICEKWRELEKQARKDKRSIWKEENPIPPWQWKAKR